MKNPQKLLREINEATELIILKRKQNQLKAEMDNFSKEMKEFYRPKSTPTAPTEPAKSEGDRATSYRYSPQEIYELAQNPNSREYQEILSELRESVGQ